jgi:UDP-sugar pyrophosphorylase
LCFSPVKNATSDGAALQKKGSPAGVAATGEADQYCAVREILRSIGCNVADAEPATYKDITIVPGPQIVLKPDFVCCPAEYKKAFPTPEKVNISANSSLVVKGSGVMIESLDLDGALVIECEEGAKGVIRNLTVTNAGWMLSPVVTSEDEIIAMRGYIIDKRETKRIVFKKNGSIEGDYDPNATTICAPTATPANGKSASRSVPELNQPASNETSQKQKEDECTCTIL